MNTGNYGSGRFVPARRPRRGRLGWMVVIALGAAAGAMALYATRAGQLAAERRQRWVRDYHGRSGFPRPVEEMRGIARDFIAPRDMRAPAPMRPSLH